MSIAVSRIAVAPHFSAIAYIGVLRESRTESVRVRSVFSFAPELVIVPSPMPSSVSNSRGESEFHHESIEAPFLIAVAAVIILNVDEGGCALSIPALSMPRPLSPP